MTHNDFIHIESATVSDTDSGNDWPEQEYDLYAIAAEMETINRIARREEEEREEREYALYLEWLAEHPDGIEDTDEYDDGTY